MLMVWDQTSEKWVLCPLAGRPGNNLSIGGQMYHQAAHVARWSCVLVGTQLLDHPARLSVARLSVVTWPRKKYLEYLIYVFERQSHVVQSGVKPDLSLPLESWATGVHYLTQVMSGSRT